MVAGADAGFPEFGWSRAEIEMGHKKDFKKSRTELGWWDVLVGDVKQTVPLHLCTCRIVGGGYGTCRRQTNSRTVNSRTSSRLALMDKFLHTAKAYSATTTKYLHCL